MVLGGTYETDHGLAACKANMYPPTELLLQPLIVFLDILLSPGHERVIEHTWHPSWNFFGVIQSSSILRMEAPWDGKERERERTDSEPVCKK